MTDGVQETDTLLLTNQQVSTFSQDAMKQLQKIDIRAVAALLVNCCIEADVAEMPYRKFCSLALQKIRTSTDPRLDDVFSGSSKSSVYQIINYCLQDLSEAGLAQFTLPEGYSGPEKNLAVALVGPYLPIELVQLLVDEVGELYEGLLPEMSSV